MDIHVKSAGSYQVVISELGRLGRRQQRGLAAPRRVVELRLEIRQGLRSAGNWGGNWAMNRSGGPCRGGLRRRTNQSTGIGPGGGGREALEVPACLPELPTSLARPEGESLV